MKVNQRTRILKGLHARQWLSLADALDASPPIYRLSERIRELEKMGYEIESRRVEGKTFQEYHLKSEPAKPIMRPEGNKMIMYVPKYEYPEIHKNCTNQH